MHMNVNVVLEGSNVGDWNFYELNDRRLWVYDLWDTGFFEKIQAHMRNSSDDRGLYQKVRQEIIDHPHGCAVVLETPNRALAISDHFQSYTLFYLEDGENVTITDRPETLVHDSSKLDQNNLYGFMYTRHTLGNRTFIKRLKQIPAGQLLEVSDTACMLKPHYVYENEYNTGFDEEAGIKELRDLFIEVFKEFVTLNQNRQLVLLLSGGYDSRLILWALDQVQAPNVLLCSYGNRFQRDVKWAQDFSKLTPYQWVFVRRHYGSMRSYYQSEEKKQYYAQAHKFCRKPNTIDMVAIKSLKERGLLEDDTVFINGMSGGFISGAHLEPELKQPVSYDQITDLITQRHFNMWNWEESREVVRDTVKQQIYDDLSNSAILEEHSDSLFEWWGWRERQSKIMVSTVNEFDWHGYRLAMPLWDKRLADFFRKVPFEHRLNQEFFKKFTASLKTRSGGSFNEVPHTVNDQAGPLLKARRFAEYITQPKWGSYTIAQIKQAKGIANEVLGTGKMNRPPKIAGISTGLIVSELLKNYELEN